MRIKALVSFSGALTMGIGEVKECSDKAILQDLIQAGYVEPVREEKTREKPSKKKVAKNEGK